MSILTIKTDEESKDETGIRKTNKRRLGGNKSNDVGIVAFDKVSIREYKIVCGDNPSISEGPPIQLDWSSIDTFNGAVDEFEEEREDERRSHPSQMKIPSRVRTELLLYFGSTKAEIESCARKAQKVKKQRNHTLASYEASPHLDESIEKLTRAFTKPFRRSKKF